jgi:hypothetical protein
VCNACLSCLLSPDGSEVAGSSGGAGAAAGDAGVGGGDDVEEQEDIAKQHHRRVSYTVDGVERWIDKRRLCAIYSTIGHVSPDRLARFKDASCSKCSGCRSLFVVVDSRLSWLFSFADVMMLSSDTEPGFLPHSLVAGQDCAVLCEVAGNDGVFVEKPFIGRVIRIAGVKGSSEICYHGSVSLETRPENVRVYCAWYSEVESELASGASVPTLQYELGPTDHIPGT